MIVENEKKLVANVDWSEHKETWGGDFPELNFYIIRRHSPDCGIGSNISVYMIELAYMKEVFPEFIPIIDLESYPHTISEVDGNAWDIFFEQPNWDDWTLDKIRYAKNVVLACGDEANYKQAMDIRTISYEKLKKAGWDKIFDQYIRLKRDFRGKLENEWKKNIGGKKKILGVYGRGTDYVKLRPKNHPIPPTAEQLIAESRMFLDGHSEYSHIFLATEDKNIHQSFVEAFPGKLIIHKRQYTEYKKGYIQYQNKSNTKNTMDYLHELYFLSRCDSLITARCSGLIVALLMNQGRFEIEKIFNLGYYN